MPNTGCLRIAWEVEKNTDVSCHCGESDSVVLGQEWEWRGEHFNKLPKQLGSKVWLANIHFNTASDWSSPPPKTAVPSCIWKWCPVSFTAWIWPWSLSNVGGTEQPARQEHQAVSPLLETHSPCSPSDVSLGSWPYIRASGHVCTFPFEFSSGNSSLELELITDFQVPDSMLATGTLIWLNLFFLFSPLLSSPLHLHWGA